MTHFLKGIPFALIFCVVGATAGKAQTFEASLLAGFNMTQIDGDDMVGYNRIGVNAGAQVATNLSEQWSFSLGFLFSQQGSNRAKADPYGPYDNIRLNYVEAPLLLHFQDWKMVFTAGGSYARLINYTSISLIGEDITDLEKYKPGTINYILGATLRLNDHWGVNLQYSKSFNSFQNDDARPKLFNRMITIRGVYTI
ncbi:MAG: PorT family protein [Lewinellaceae bacterium]|nr:PorT family protein [Lewinella sp.]MCB9281156.1 PorT family protein [Lewinellaceae bacterium]